MMSRSLITSDLKLRVSSTLDKSVGKKFLTDGNPETCWTSTQGTPQFIQLTFPNSVIPEKISLTFQGGFAGTQTAVYTSFVSPNDWKLLARIYPEDVNRRQIFVLPEGDRVEQCEQMKIVFEESSDFFGRITIYDIDIEGIVITDNKHDTVES